MRPIDLVLYREAVQKAQSRAERVRTLPPLMVTMIKAQAPKKASQRRQKATNAR